jgi:hypothetical protein
LSRGEHEQHGVRLRFTLSRLGTSNPVHLASNIAIAESGPLPADLYEEAKKRPSALGRANQKPAASALNDYCRSRVDGRDAADAPDRSLAAGLPHMPK